MQSLRLHHEARRIRADWNTRDGRRLSILQSLGAQDEVVARLYNGLDAAIDAYDGSGMRSGVLSDFGPVRIICKDHSSRSRRIGYDRVICELIAVAGRSRRWIERG